MCGICGIVNRDPSQSVDPNVLARMNRQIAHRGPDDEGFFVEETVGLAMRRLSVIDVKTGRQPIANEDETLWIVFNGEIYNHAKLRAELESRGHRYRTRSDTETIIHLYEQYGRDCLKHLHGMFAFAIWDRPNKTLLAARDRLGIKPFYYRYDGKTLLFGSEIKAILAYAGVRNELNCGVLSEYLAFGYLSGSETMFAGIDKLAPGHTLEMDAAGQLSITPYWDLTVPVDEELYPREYYVKTYREMLEASVSSHLMSDVPLGVFLSGGLDSSAIAALTTKIRREPIETFAVGYAEEEFNELSYAHQVARHIGSRHNQVQLCQDDFFSALPVLIWHEDEPIVWPSSVALYFVAKLARERVKVVLTGEGSDETLGGYTRYAWTLVNSRMDNVYRGLTPAFFRKWVRDIVGTGVLPSSLRRRLEHTFVGRDGASFSSFYFDNFYSSFSAAEQSELLTPIARQQAGKAYINSMAFWDRSSGDLLHRLLYTDIRTYMVELLMKQDQMSMAASVESRVPFLDHELVEFTARIPARYSIQGFSGKHILKLAVADLLPESIVYRKKMGFPTPWAHWLAGPQFERLESMLVHPRTIERGLIERDKVKELFAEHRMGRRDNGSRIWRLLNLEIWQRIFLDGELATAESVLPHATAPAAYSQTAVVEHSGQICEQ
jgi:asparagine synthase (glutamine-hydrolysing)